MPGRGADVIGGGSDLAVTLGQIAAAGTLSLEGGAAFAPTSLSNAGLIDMAGGTLSGAIAIAAGGTISGFGVLSSATLLDAGSVVAEGGSLLITGTLQGAGNAAIGTGGVLALDGTATVSVGFIGAGTLALAQGGSLFTGAVQGFSAGDTLLLQGFSGSSASYAGGVLTVSGASGTTTIDLTGSGTGSGFQLAQDAAGDTLVRLAVAGPTLTAPASLIASADGNTPIGGLGIGDAAGGTVTVTLSDAFSLIGATRGRRCDAVFRCQ